MNYIWCAMIIISLAAALINGSMDATLAAAFEGARASVETLLSFAGAMCFWTGILKVAEKSGVSDWVQRLLNPVIKRLFPRSDSQTRRYIGMNMTANLLGMGNAATPMGVKAMECMDRANDNPLYPSREMCLFVVLNTTSFQLIPTTILALRSAAGSSDPMSVVAPIWITSAVSVVTAVSAVCLMWRKKR